MWLLPWPSAVGASFCSGLAETQLCTSVHHISCKSTPQNWGGLRVHSQAGATVHAHPLLQVSGPSLLQEGFSFGCWVPPPGGAASAWKPSAALWLRVSKVVKQKVLSVFPMHVYSQGCIKQTENPQYPRSVGLGHDLSSDLVKAHLWCCALLVLFNREKSRGTGRMGEVCVHVQKQVVLFFDRSVIYRVKRLS